MVIDVALVAVRLLLSCVISTAAWMDQLYILLHLRPCECTDRVCGCVACSDWDAEHGEFLVQGSTLPVKQEDTEILDLIILKAGALRQKVRATLGSKLPLQVR